MTSCIGRYSSDSEAAYSKHVNSGSLQYHTASVQGEADGHSHGIANHKVEQTGKAKREAATNLWVGQGREGVELTRIQAAAKYIQSEAMPLPTR